MGCGCGKKVARPGQSVQPPVVNRLAAPRLGSDRVEAAKTYQSATMGQGAQAAVAKVTRKVV